MDSVVSVDSVVIPDVVDIQVSVDSVVIQVSAATADKLAQVQQSLQQMIQPQHHYIR